MEIVITRYNDAMREQVISMFEKEYTIEKQNFNKLFEDFYLQPFQEGKCILIVALDGSIVAGFQSFFFWPYTFCGKSFMSFQSGNSLVNPIYRGKGIFQKMLAFLEQDQTTNKIDCLVGFPVEASIKNFIKDKWHNIFNLNWYLKITNPFAFFFKEIKNKPGFEKGLINLPDFNCDKIRLSQGYEFVKWRDNYLQSKNYFSFVFKKNNETIIFHLKKNKRKKIINELIIGNIIRSSEKTDEFLGEAFNNLIKNIGKSFHFISIALNEDADNKLLNNITPLNFKKTKKTIYFIVKPFSNHDVFLNKKNWVVYRSDIDTW